MTETTVLANARLILPDEVVTGALTITDGVIAALETGFGVPSGAVDCEGDYVAPGLIELHTDNLERHMRPRPKVDWPHTAAILAHDGELASTGITTVFDAMRVGSSPGRPGRYKPYARQLANELWDLRNRDGLKISHLLHLRAEVCSETLIEEMAAFGPQDRVRIVSLMDHTPGQRQFRDLAKLETYTKGKHGLNDAQFKEHVATLQALGNRVGDTHERAAVAEARRYKAILASHDDTTVGQVENSARHGVQVAEFPTTREAAEACRAHGIAVMMGAPNLIRGGSHSGNVAAQELAEAGLLDILSSDYVPAALLLAAVRLGEEWGDMARGLATVTQAPARAVELEDRGRLAPGLRADVIRFYLHDGFPRLRGVWSRGMRVG